MISADGSHSPSPKARPFNNRSFFRRRGGRPDWGPAAHLATLGLALLTLALVSALPLLRAVEAVRPDPVQAAWEQARSSAGYQFSSDVRQITTPSATIGNIGRSSREERMHLEGRTDTRADLVELRLWTDGGTVLQAESGIEVRIEQGKAMARRGGGSWQEIPGLSETIAPQGDFMSYLVAVRDVVASAPERRGGVEFTRYSFTIDGPTLARYLRDTLEEQLRQRGELTIGARLSIPEAHNQVSGSGELWVGSDGMPLRQILMLQLPPQNDEYLTLNITTNFSDFAAVPANRFDLLVAAVPLLQGLAMLAIALLVASALIIYRSSRALQRGLALLFTLLLAASPLLTAQQAHAAMSAYGARLDAQDQQREASVASEEAYAAVTAAQSDPHRDPLAQAETTWAAQQSLASGPAVAAAAPNDSVDTDGDGLTDFQETILGTSPTYPDSDDDGVSDGVEVRGFSYAGKQWYGNPDSRDSNGDRIADTREWLLDTNSDGKPDDTDNDMVPDAFDDDNDGDQVPDAFDLAPQIHSRMGGGGQAPYDELTPLKLTINDLEAGKPTFVDFQIRPDDEDHLWFAQNVLDWPHDTQSQFQDGDDKTFADLARAEGRQPAPNESHGDMKLVPMLEIRISGPNTSLPSQDELSPYSIGVNDLTADGSQKVVYVPLNVISDDQTGARVAFNGRMLYKPGTTWGNAHEVRLVWTVQLLADVCKESTGGYCTAYESYNQLQVIQSYYDRWTLTGLSVREDHGASAAIIYEDPAVDSDLKDDASLWLLSAAADQSFVSARDQNNDGKRDVTIADLAQRVDRDRNGSLSETQRWGIPRQLQVEQNEYAHLDEAIMATSMTETGEVLNQFDTSWAQDKTLKPLLMFAREERFRSLGLDAIGAADDSATLAGSALTLDMATNTRVPLLTVASLKWSAYCGSGDTTPTWQTCPYEQYWTELDGRVRPTVAEPGDTPDMVEGRMVTTQLYYLSLSQGINTVVQSDATLTPSTTAPFSDDNLTTFILILGDAIGTVGKVGVNVVFGFQEDEATKQPSLMEALGKGWKSGSGISKFSGLLAAPVTIFAKEVWHEGVAGKLHIASLGLTVLGGIGAVAFGFALLGASIAAGELSASVGVTVGLAVSVGILLTGVITVHQIGLTVKAVQQMKSVLGFSTKDALKLVLKSDAGVIQNFKAARITGAIGAIAGAWGVFIYSMVSTGTTAFSPAFNKALAETIATTLYIILLTVISATVIGTILVGLITLIDAILTVICELGVDDLKNAPGLGGACFTLGTAAVKIIAKLLYSFDTLVDSERNDLVVTGSLDAQLRDPARGYVTGNPISITLPVTTTIYHKQPDPANFNHSLPYLPSLYNLGKLRATTFAYSLSRNPETLEGVPDAMHYDWRMTPFDTFGPQVTLYRGQASAYRHSPAPLRDITLTPGLNRPLDFYLNIGYSLPSYQCFGIPIGLLVIIPVCKSGTLPGSSSTRIDALKYDILPDTLDGFMTFGDEGNGGLGLAWDAGFGTLYDADGDGLRSSAYNGIDPNDSTWDADGDGLSDLVEIERRAAGLGFSPVLWDTDNDGLTDAQELLFKSDPARRDSDNDTIADGDEVYHQAYTFDNASGRVVATSSYVGGYTLTVPGPTNVTARISTNPNSPDRDLDGINDPAERALYEQGVRDANGFFYSPATFNSPPLAIDLAVDDADGFLARGQTLNYTSNVQSVATLGAAAVEVEHPAALGGGFQTSQLVTPFTGTRQVPGTAQVAAGAASQQLELRSTFTGRLPTSASTWQWLPENNNSLQGAFTNPARGVDVGATRADRSDRYLLPTLVSEHDTQLCNVVTFDRVKVVTADADTNGGIEPRIYVNGRVVWDWTSGGGGANMVSGEQRGPGAFGLPASFEFCGVATFELWESDGSGDLEDDQKVGTTSFKPTMFTRQVQSFTGSGHTIEVGYRIQPANGDIFALNLPEGRTRAIEQDNSNATNLRGNSTPRVSCNANGVCMVVYDQVDNCNTVTISTLTVGGGDAGTGPDVVVYYVENPDEGLPPDNQFGGYQQLYYVVNANTVDEQHVGTLPLTTELCGAGRLEIFEWDNDPVSGNGISKPVWRGPNQNIDPVGTVFLHPINTTSGSQRLQAATDGGTITVDIDVAVPTKPLRTIAASFVDPALNDRQPPRTIVAQPSPNLLNIAVNDLNPSIATDGSTFMVAWERIVRRLSLETASQLWVQRFGADGAALSSAAMVREVTYQPFDPNSDIKTHTFMDLEWIGDRYRLFWLTADEASPAIRYQTIAADGSLLDGAFVLNTDQINSAAGAPHLAYDPHTGQSLVVYANTQGNIVAQRFRNSINAADGPLQLWGGQYADVAYQPSSRSWLLTWQNPNNGVFHYEARKADQALTPLLAGAPRELGSFLGAVAPAGYSIACPDASATPSLDLRFEELPGASSFVDESGSGLIATAVNNNPPRSGVPGAPQASSSALAVQFDGQNDGLSVPRPVRDSFSIAFWLNTTQQSAMLIDAHNPGTSGYWLSLDGGKLRFDTLSAANIGNTVFSSSSVADGKWHYVVATRAQTTGATQLFVDGVPAGTKGGGPTGALGDIADLRIGGSLEGTSLYAGQLDALAFYTSVLADDSVQSLYQRTMQNYCLAAGPAGNAIRYSRLELQQNDTRGTILPAATATLALTIDADQPTAAVASLQDGRIVQGSSSGTTLIIGGTAADPTSLVERVEVSVNAGPWQAAEGKASWTFGLQMTEGRYAVRVRAIDAVGNVGQASAPITVIADATGPSGSITTPSAPLVPTRAANGDWSVQITGTLIDQVRGQGLQAGVNPESVEVLLQDAAGNSNGWQRAVRANDWAVNYRLPAGMINPSGIYTATMRVADLVGNPLATGQTSSTIRLDAAGPVGAITIVGSTTQVLSGTTTLTGLITDTVGLSGVDKLEVAFTPIQQPVALSGAVMLLPFDERPGASYFADRTEQRNDARCAASCPTAGEPGSVDSALVFSGLGPVTVPSAETMSWVIADGLSMQVWAKSTADGRLLVKAFDPTNPIYELGYAGGGHPYLRLFNVVIRADKLDLRDGQWHQLVGVASPIDGRARLFVDGVEQASAAIGFSGVASTGTPLEIGGSAIVPGAQWNGGIDQVALWQRALSPAEVQALFDGVDVPRYTATIAQPGADSSSWSLPLPTGLEGMYQIDLYATDRLGNRALTPNAWRVVVDTRAPALSVTAQHTGRSYVDANGLVFYEFGYSCAATDLHVAEQGFSCTPESQAAATLAANTTPPLERGFVTDLVLEPLFPDRTVRNRLATAFSTWEQSPSPSTSAQACDQYGNCATASAQPDNAAPAPDPSLPLASVVSPAHNSVVAVGTTLDVQLAARAASGLKQVVLKLDGQVVQTITYPADPPQISDSRTLSLSGVAEGRHTILVEATDLAGVVQTNLIATSFDVDTQNPTLGFETTVLGNADTYEAGSGVLRLRGTASDSVGLAAVLVRVDNQPFQDATFDGTTWHTASYFGTAPEGKTFSVTVRAIDRAGRTTEVVRQVQLDLDPPGEINTRIVSRPPEVSSSRSASFSFTGTAIDNVPLTGFECSLDNGAFATCATPLSLSDLTEGEHSLSVRAFDADGNQDPTPATYSWLVDTIAPETVLDSTPSPFSNSSGASFAFSGSDSGSGVASFACSLDGAAFTTCTSPASFGSLAEGQHSLAVRALDRAGNTDASPATFTWLVDLTAPETVLNGKPPALTTANTAQFTFSGSDNGSGVSGFLCSLDGAELTPCTSPASFSGLADGVHTFQVRTVDKALNQDLSPASYSWTIDRTPPTMVCSVTPKEIWPPNHKLVTVTASVEVKDATSGAAGFKLLSVTSNEPDSGTEKEDVAQDIQGFSYGTPDISGQLRAERSPKGNGRIYTLTYQGVDVAGNTATCAVTVTVPKSQGK